MSLSSLISRIRGESQTIGVDIGHRLVKVAVIAHKQGGSAVLTALEQEPLKDGVVVDNEIKNTAALVDSIQTVLRRALPGGVSGDLIFSVNWTNGILCDRILVKPVPKVPENELVIQAAMGRSPFDDAGNALDYIVVGRKDEGIDAMVVAAKTSMLSSWINIFNALGIKPLAVDVDVFALRNAYVTSQGGDGGDESLLIFNIGFNKSHLTFINGRKFGTARSIMGCSLFEIQEQLEGSGLSKDQCQKVLNGNSNSPQDANDAEVKKSLEFAFEEIQMKLDMAVRYLMSSSDNYGKPSKMILAGGGANIKGLAPFLAEKLDMEVKVLQPFKELNKKLNKASMANLGSVGGIYACAVGLALRRF